MNWSLGFKILPYIISAVTAVETFATDIKGADKKAAALKLVATLLPAVEGASGGRVDLDDAKVSAAVGELIDAYVAVQNLLASRA